MNKRQDIHGLISVIKMFTTADKGFSHIVGANGFVINLIQRDFERVNSRTDNKLTGPLSA